MKKRRIIYTVDVDFTDLVPEVTVTLWADGIARGIEHNKPEVKHVEYDIQVRDLPEPELPATPDDDLPPRKELERGEN